MEIISIDLVDNQLTTLTIGRDGENIYINIEEGVNFTIKRSEWDFFIKKIQQVNQLLQQEEDESKD